MKIRVPTASCFECWQTRHFNRNYPKLRKNGHGGNNNEEDNNINNNQDGGNGAKRRVFVIGKGEACNDLTVVNDKFSINGYFASKLFGIEAYKTFISSKFSKLLYIVPSDLDSKCAIELADGSWFVILLSVKLS